MARWPRHVWTSIFTYAVILILFPILCYLAYVWVRGGWGGLHGAVLTPPFWYR